jgi:predicted transport protein
MSDISLFRIASGEATEMQGTASDLEKPLQKLIEHNLDPLLGVRFLANEYSTGKTHLGRIDTLGLDENACPVILEYKRSSGENVINQGLFYLDWLMDHQAEFKLLVLERYGRENADAIDWTAPRLICIAADFTKYDGHAVQQMNRNIDLIRYRRFGNEFLLLELVNAVTTKPISPIVASGKTSAKRLRAPRGAGTDKSVSEWLADMTGPMRELFESLEGYLLSLGDDVQRKDLKLYIAFKRIKNFTTIEIRRDKLVVFLRVNPDDIDLVDGFSRDVRAVGHWGTGNLEVMLRNQADLDRAKALIRRAYDGGKSSS